MNNIEFKAYVVDETDGNFTGEVKHQNIEALPKGELVLRVHYSSLNYKDALSASGNKGVTKEYPHTPGIDAVGTVVESEDSQFSIGDKLIVTSYDLGMNTAGGFGEYIRVPSEWALKLPEQLSMKEAMIYGTAGLTAGMSVQHITNTLKPEAGPIIVSGATGGVGTLSVLILSKLGFEVTAITGKVSEHDFLQSLGAKKIILREDFEALDNKPLLKPLYAGAIDTVGGPILENIIKSTLPNGIVTCCGNVASPKLNLSVFPFILRGITLAGIDSQNHPMAERIKVWDELALNWKPKNLATLANEITLNELPDKIRLMLAGKLKGRTLINLSRSYS